MKGMGRRRKGMAYCEVSELDRQQVRELAGPFGGAFTSGK